MIVVLVYALMWMLVSTEEQKYIEGVIELQKNNFNQATLDFKYLLVYFASQKCKYCVQFDLTYAVLERKLKSYQSNNDQKFPQYPRVQFAKILYEKNEDIFNQYHIQQSPNLRLFINGTIVPIDYDCLDYNEQAIPYAEEWIYRLATSLPKYNSNKQVENNQVIISCSSQFINQINSLRHTDLSAGNKMLMKDYYCSDDANIVNSNDQIILIGKNKQKEIIKIKDDKFQTQLREKLNYRRGLVRWSNSIARQIFTYNHNAFLLLVNKESYSDNMLRIYRAIRDSWNFGEIFVFAELTEDLQQVSNLRQFIGIQIQGKYPFPLLTYITHQDGRIVKYRYKKQIEEKEQGFVGIPEYYVKEQVREWMNNAVKGQLEEHFKSFGQETTQSIYEFGTGEIHRVNYPDLVTIFDKSYNHPFLIYVEWRNNFLCNYIADSINKKWNEHHYYKSINMYSFGLNSNDLIPPLQTKITRVPAIIYVDEHKNVKVNQDINSFEDIVKFLEINLPKSSTNQPNQQ